MIGSIIAVVLNIIGIIALILVGVLLLALFILALALLVPVCYKCEGNIDGMQFMGNARASWLFGLVAIVMHSDGAVDLRLLGIRIWRFVSQDPEPSAQSSAPEKCEEPAPEGFKEPSQKERERANAENQEPDRRKQKLKDRVSELTGKLRGVWHTIESIKDYPDKDEIFRQALRLVRSLLAAAMPKRLELSGDLGFEDPSSTGYAAGAVSVISAFSYPRITLRVAPDFSREVFKLRLLVRGKIVGVSFVIPVCKFLLCKPVWKLLKLAISTRNKLKPSMQNV